MSLHYLQPYATFSSQGKVTKWSPALEKASGWPSSQAVGRQISELIVPLIPAELPDVTDSTAGISWEGLVALPGFCERAPMPARATIEKHPNGEAILSLEALANTEPKPCNAAEPAEMGSSARAEEDCLNAQRLELILDHMRGFCYTVNRDLVFTSSLGAGLAGLQLKPNQLVGTSLISLWNASDPKYEPLACHLRALAGIEQTYQDECMGRSLEYRLVPQYDRDGAVTGVIGVGFDVTEQEHAKEEQIKLSAMLRQAQKMESIGRLAGGVAHDFNNQLTCIMGHLSLAGRLVTDPRVAHHLRQAISAVDSAAMLTRQLLAFSRKQVIMPRPLHLGTLVERLNDMLQRVIGEGIRLSIDWAKDLWQVHADPGQLEQILMNLVVNARDAIETAGEIRVELRNREIEMPLPAVSGLLDIGKYVELSVSDTGRGIPDAIRPKLFEPFFTTKEVGAGTGLGLATVYGAVVQNNGNIIVESRLGEGSRFSVYLPMTEVDPKSSTTLDPLPPSTPIEACSGTETILLVEDEPSLLEAAQCTLQQLGYTVLACCGPGEALRSFREHAGDIELLVTDVVMPRMNGKELASRVQAIRPETVVLFTSGYSEQIVTQQGVVQGGLNFLNKPYRPIELAAKVRSILDQRHRPRTDHGDSTGGYHQAPSGHGDQQAG
jgi:signal transduction histidine kinase/ActR/RegA family two-component response regulator